MSRSRLWRRPTSARRGAGLQTDTRWMRWGMENWLEPRFSGHLVQTGQTYRNVQKYTVTHKHIYLSLSYITRHPAFSSFCIYLILNSLYLHLFMYVSIYKLYNNYHLKHAFCCLRFTLDLFETEDIRRSLNIFKQHCTWHQIIPKSEHWKLSGRVCTHHTRLQNAQVSLWDKSRGKHHHIQIFFYQGNDCFWAQWTPCCSNDNQANSLLVSKHINQWE